MEQVLDASVAIGWCAPAQATPLTRAALVAVNADGAEVPAPFFFEVIYGLEKQVQRNAITRDHFEWFLRSLPTLPISVSAGHTSSQMIELYELARRHRLSIFDAAYLELAMRRNLPLATRDRALARAATEAGVPLFQP